RRTPAPSLCPYTTLFRSQPLVRKLERVEHLVAPPALGDVEEERAGSIGHVDRALAGQPEADVVLREEDVSDPRVGLGLDVADARSEEHTSELQSLRHLVC